jgi:D-sedoheptulose 7-phosphate isomerase
VKAEAIQLVRAALEESARVKQLLQQQAGLVAHVAERITEAFRAGNRLYACGNGGSACDAIHLVEELVARYKRERPGLPAHHLLDGPTLTCWSNDYEFATAFQRQVETLVRPGDVLVAISTGGNAESALLAAAAARRQGALVIGLTGQDGGQLRQHCDECIRVPSDTTERVQEAHITLIHLICELVEGAMFPAPEVAQ